ncbi:MAG TPA: hypothetical protein PLX60_12620 [Chitinophagales bacterium]|nr:hypothetical protein [Chitinophagales bacterium]
MPILLIIGCNKQETTKLLQPGAPQMLHYIDSMLAEVGVNSYTDVLTGKLEGNFEFFSYTAPYESNCTNFKPGTQLNGSVATDSTHMVSLNAGDLYVNDFVIKANPSNNFRYVVNIGDANYIANQNELNKMYGKTNHIRLLKDGSEIFDKKLYIPPHIYMKGYNCTQLKMQGNPIVSGVSTIMWNADYNNKNGVLIQILGRDINNVERYTDRLVSDIGKYTITANDISIYPKDKNRFLGLKITITRGNFFLSKGSDGRKYNFTLTTNCDYYYELP